MAERLGGRLMERLAVFAAHSDEPGQLTRLYLSPAHKRAAGQLSAWMGEAGLSVSMDALGTVVGRYEGAAPHAPALLIGSHIDTVRDAGRYDGTLGVLAGLTAVEELAKRGERFPFAIEIVAFGDEEGVRFPTTLAGSRALAGQFDPAALKARDTQGISLKKALIDFGCDPAKIGVITRSRDEVLGYIEPHIEQGPILESEHLPIGAVSAINGVKRFTAEVSGEAGHAGTVPMGMRHDALTAAADMMITIERIALATKDVVATVGRADVAPGAVNVIPSTVTFTIDLRAPSDASRDDAANEIAKATHDIAYRRGVGLLTTLNHEAPATACSPAVTRGLLRAIKRQGIAARTLTSGAGHDAMAVAALCPIGMLFVRCAGGISHNPKESISVADADMCVRVLLDYVRNVDAGDFIDP